MATITLKHGDVLEELKQLPDDSVDAIITDPPYNLSFMGKKWDSKGAPKQFEEWCCAWATECLRVLRNGGYLLSFGGTRTFHRIASGIEDSGFVIKDCLSWNYGSGFPKSHNISKAIDKNKGQKREVIGVGRSGDPETHTASYNMSKGGSSKMGGDYEITQAASRDAKRWDGYGTALKPAWEPIILAQKPFKGTIVNNVLTQGVGGLNIDENRIPTQDGKPAYSYPQGAGGIWSHEYQQKHPDATGFTQTSTVLDNAPSEGSALGRWPANTIFDEEAGHILDSQSGHMNSVKSKRGVGFNDSEVYGTGDSSFDTVRGFADSGGASRFFYCPKTPKKERSCLGHVENKHPTVKPLKLMEHLVALVCPSAEAMGRTPVILDCFVGSGSTAIAAHRMDFDCIGIDADEQSLKTARLRLMNDWRLEKGTNPLLRGFISKQVIEEEE